MIKRFTRNWKSSKTSTDQQLSVRKWLESLKEKEELKNKSKPKPDEQ